VIPDGASDLSETATLRRHDAQPGELVATAEAIDVELGDTPRVVILVAPANDHRAKRPLDLGDDLGGR
jgi:hypothetical protein